MRAGFSLVELSIVLVILGLLTGGILTGQSLIRAAELRSVTTEFQNYQTAVMTFRDKYFALPGDMKNATDFWGAADSSGAGGECSDPDNDTGSGTQTCNGDGDGLVIANERYRMWQHLANAGLIEGTYSGTEQTTGHTPGVNIPTSKISGAGWHTNSSGSVSGNVEFFDGDYGNALFYGTNDGSTIHGTVFTPEEAWNIDKKLDDGRPGDGRVVVFKDSGTQNPNCATGDTSAAAYELSSSAVLCSFVFKKAY